MTFFSPLWEIKKKHHTWDKEMVERAICESKPSLNTNTRSILTIPLRFCRHRLCYQFGQWQFLWSQEKMPWPWQHSSSFHTARRYISQEHYHSIENPDSVASCVWVFLGKASGIKLVRQKVVCTLLMRGLHDSQTWLLRCLLTLESAGLVENLSLFSPCSSYSKTTLSTVHTANLLLFGAHVIQVTFAAPSCGTTNWIPCQYSYFTRVTSCSLSEPGSVFLQSCLWTHTKKSTHTPKSLHTLTSRTFSWRKKLT